jgi:hypothetical protein
MKIEKLFYLSLLFIFSWLNQPLLAQEQPSSGMESSKSIRHSLSSTSIFDSSYMFFGHRYWGQNFWTELDLYSEYTETIATNLGTYYLRGTGTSFGLNKLEEVGILADAYYIHKNVTYSAGIFYIHTFDDLCEGIDYDLEVEWSIDEDKKVALNLIYNHAWAPESHGWFIQAQAEKNFPINNKLSMNLETTLDYAFDFIGVNGWNSFIIKAKFPYYLTEHTLLEPYFAHSFALEGIREIGEENHGFYGVAVVHFF